MHIRMVKPAVVLEIHDITKQQQYINNKVNYYLNIDGEERIQARWQPKVIIKLCVQFNH